MKYLVLQKIKFCLFQKLFKVTFNDFIVIAPSLDFGSIELRKLVSNMIYEFFFIDWGNLSSSKYKYLPSKVEREII